MSGMVGVTSLATEFGRRPENSARSVLVTIFGDSIVPLGGQVWLGDLIALMEPFGFSDRLVRTSVYRLTSEGWLDSDRIGRRSRYRLTDYARREFTAADARIYDLPEVDWGGEWTLVFTELAAVSSEQRHLVDEHLGWAGFARLTSGVRALPGEGSAQVRDLEARLGLPGRLPVATARFEDLAPLAGNGRMSEVFGLAEAARRYDDVESRYGGLPPVGEVDGREAYVLRTMLVHDLRRAALIDPCLPGDLLPRDWAGGRAREVARRVYREVDDAAWTWLEEVTDLRVDLPERFTAA